MNRTELEKYICETYGTNPDSPWLKYPEHKVFRHRGNNKWFALIMEVSKVRLGLQEEGNVDIVNFKCDPVLIGSLRAESGFFPAYHMSRERWITVSLDGRVSDEKMKMLLDMSFELTAPKIKKRC